MRRTMRRQEAIALGVSQYAETVVVPTFDVPNILKRSMDNKKLGKRREWRSGAFRGMPLYSLTLEERATCDTGCAAWSVCYGNHMPFAKRYDATQDGGLSLMARLTYELDKLDKKHPDGYSIRLHILGDFFSVAYVQFWAEALEYRPALHIYGYTHRQGEIKAEIDRVWREYGGRFNILQSDGSADDMRPLALLETTPGSESLPVCPEQSGKAQGCLDCGLCTNAGIKGVRFLIH